MSFFSFKTKNNNIISGKTFRKFDFYIIVEEFSTLITEISINDYDFVFTLPELKKLDIKNSYHVDISSCPNIQEVKCSNLYKLEVGSLRPHINGQVESLFFDGKYSFFNNLIINKIFNRK